MSNDRELLDSLHPRLIAKIEKDWGHGGFTDIQRNAIPPILNGKNVLLLAPTAGGKTEASLLPVISNLLQNDSTEYRIRSIFIAPLRALLNDLDERVENWASACGLSSFKWHGDVSRASKKSALKNPPDIMLTTPESLEVLLLSPQTNSQELFGYIESIIIDEAHYFADNSRGAQLISLIERIENISEYTIQRIGLSATVGNPDLIISWLSGESHLKQQVIRAKGKEKNINIKVRYIDEEEIDFHEKYNQALSSFAHVGKSIFFNNSKRNAEKLARDLELINIKSEVHHGSLSKLIREEAEHLMKISPDCVISATSTLELGIDIGNLDRVIQCDNLPSVNSYLQRLGRTGRRADTEATLGTIVKDPGTFLLNLAIISKGNENYSEPLKPSSKRYDILFQQLLTAIVGEYGVNVDSYWNILKNAFCFKDITQDEYYFLLEYWQSKDWITVINRVASLGLTGEKIFSSKNYMELYSVFQTSDDYEVIHQGEPIGVLDAMFVHTMSDEFYFRLAGRKWVVEDIDTNMKKLFVQKSHEAPPPLWMGGGGYNIEYPVAQRVRELTCGEYTPDFLEEQELSLLEYLQKGQVFLPALKDEIKIRKHEGGISIVTYAGTMVNDVICTWLKKITGLSLVTSDYIAIDIDSKKFTAETAIATLQQILNSTHEGISPETWAELFVERGEGLEFSKYSEYLPSSFNVQCLISSYFDRENFSDIIRNYKL